MANVIPFESAKLPAYLKPAGAVANVFAAAVSVGGFPVISIKGKVFHIKRGDEKLLVTKPDDPDEPAASIEVVIVGNGPGLSKTFYEDSYKEGSDTKPTCYSNDGVAPAPDAQAAQAKKCAICAHNAWGSGRDDKGNPTKGKACSDVMRLAVVPAGQLNDPMLLRVPPASLKALGQYGDLLAKRGVQPKHVVTKIGFDYAVASPSLTFKPARFVTEEELDAIEETLTLDIIGQITGAAPGGPEAKDFEQAVPPHIPRNTAAPVAAPAAPARRTRSKPAAQAEAPAEKPTLSADEVASALDDLDFDD